MCGVRAPPWAWHGIDVIYGGAVSLPTVANWWSDVRALLSVLCCVALSLFVVRRRGRIAFKFIIHSHTPYTTTSTESAKAEAERGTGGERQKSSEKRQKLAQSKGQNTECSAHDVLMRWPNVRAATRDDGADSDIIYFSSSLLGRPPSPVLSRLCSHLI